MLDGVRMEYKPTVYRGIEESDAAAIKRALEKGEKLTIDRNGHIHDSNGNWIADGMINSRR